MRVARTRPWTPRHSRRFEGLAESRAEIQPRSGNHWNTAVAPPYCGSVVCPRSGGVRSLDECLGCEHFVNLRPERDRRHATMRCLCCDDDPIADSLPDLAECPLVRPEASVASARVLVWTAHVPIVLVVREQEVIGVVHAGDLDECEGHERVDSVMIAQPWSLPSTAALGDAVEALRALHVPGLLVVDADRELKGVLCAADLRRMGVPAALLPR